METPLSRDASKHVTDEVINTITHIAAGCLAILGAALLIVQASVQADPWKITAFSLYGFSLVMLFTFSSLHHGLNLSPKVNRLLRTFDYISVFAVIIGTVAPLALVLYRGVFGWTFLGVVLAIAAIGIALRATYHTLPKYVTNTLFIVLGWFPALLVIAGGVSVPLGGLALLATGGILYTVGFVCFTAERPNPIPGVFGFHEIWHSIVVIAALFQYLFVYWYILPA